MVIHNDQMQVVPILTMSAGSGLSQVNVRICLLIMTKQTLNTGIRHRMTIWLFRDVVFDDAACCRSDAADCIIALKCL